MAINLLHSEPITGDYHFNFHADEMGSSVTETRLEITGDGSKIFDIRPQGNGKDTFGFAYRVTPGGDYKHLFTALKGEGLDDGPMADGRELSDANKDWPGKAYAQELSKEMDGFILYYCFGSNEAERGDSVFTYVMAEVYMNGEEKAHFTAEPW
jgi:hypothetical protein